MVAAPSLTPVTIPVVDPTVATAVLLLLHVPPGVASAKAALVPTQTTLAPDIGCMALTVTTTLVLQPPPVA